MALVMNAASWLTLSHLLYTQNESVFCPTFIETPFPSELSRAFSFHIRSQTHQPGFKVPWQPFGPCAQTLLVLYMTHQHCNLTSAFLASPACFHLSFFTQQILLLLLGVGPESIIELCTLPAVPFGKFHNNIVLSQL